MADPKKPSSGPALAGDDRNIVAIGDDTPGLSLEDHFFLFWNKYKSVVIACAVALVAAVGGKTSWDAYVAAKEAKIRTEFSEIASPDGYPAFIAAHPGHALAAVAWIEIGDDHFENKRYAEAVAAFDSAVAKLGEADPLSARARLASGMALLLDGKEAEGRLRLQQLADAVSVSSSFRAQAAFQHAVSLGASGDVAGMRAWVDRVVELDTDGGWAQRATNLRRVGVAPSVKVPAAPSVEEPSPAAP